ncbi:hypothetical protein [Pseudorhodoplanes sp.]|uniref:hypothetical protein n=1 Tax=Pseudorhodoplanes sp. TaxID=1934341 RepID=UPI00391B539B
MTDVLTIIHSSLSGEFIRDGIAVLVEVYQLSDCDGWASEVTYGHDSPIIWTEEFSTDEAAFDAFSALVDERGLIAVVNGEAGPGH